MANTTTNRDTPIDTGSMPPAGTAPTTRAGEPSEADYRRVAIRRLKKRRDFRSHLFIYLVINFAFWMGWIIDGIVNQWEFPWPVFPTVVWGLFVLGHANDVFWKDPLREELVQQEIDKLRAASHIHPLDSYDYDDDDEDDWC